MKKLLLTAVFITTAGFYLWGASLDVFTDVSESYAGQPVKLTVRIIGDSPVTRPRLPDIDGFVIQEAGESRYDETVLINGRNSRTITVEYAWNLIPSLTGRFIIPPVEVSSGKDTLRSKPIVLVIKEPEEIEGYHLFLSAAGTKSFPMIPVRVTLKWLFSSEVSRPNFVIPFYKNSRVKVRDLPAPSSSSSDIYKFSVDGHIVYAVQSAEIYEGKQYASLSMSWDILAKDSEPLKLDPVLLSFQRGVITPSGRKSYENAVIPSNQLILDIQALPPVLEQFPGGILVADSQLQVTASLDQNRIYPGDPLELTLRFQGLNSPELTDFKGIGDLDEMTGIIRADSSGLSSEVEGPDKIVRQKIRFISSNPKEFPSLEFPYFNMKTGRVDICRSLPVQITVQEFDDSAAYVNEDSPNESPVVSKKDSPPEIRDNLPSHSVSDHNLFEFVFKYRIPVVLVLLFSFTVLMISRKLTDVFRHSEKKDSIITARDLKKSLMQYEKSADRTQGHQLYDQFWCWINSLAADIDSRDKNKALDRLREKISPELYQDLLHLSDFLESVWMPEKTKQWDSVYIRVPERVMKEMGKRGRR